VLLCEFGGSDFKPILDRLIEGNATRNACFMAAQQHKSDRQAVGWAIGQPRAHLSEEMARASLGEHDDDNHRRSPFMRANAQTLDSPHFVRHSLEDALYARMTGNAPQGAARESIGAPLAAYDDIIAEARGERRRGSRAAPALGLAARAPAATRRAISPIFFWELGIAFCRNSIRSRSRPCCCLAASARAPTSVPLTC
jgi:hypothetical protein